MGGWVQGVGVARMARMPKSRWCGRVPPEVSVRWVRG